VTHGHAIGSTAARALLLAYGVERFGAWFGRVDQVMLKWEA
jgi:hypothetical protein